MRYLRLQTLGFAALLATLTAIHCIPTEAQADRRRRPWTTYVSASDRLVVACDMTSDTCSDGRKITTTRSTPVPCETSPGVWEMVPEDTACISYRGLEAWAANTSYLSYGAELVNAAWSGDATVLPLGNVSWVFGAGDSSIGQTIGSAASGDWTFTCIMRASDTTAGHTARISVGEASCDAELNPSHNSTGVGWGTYSCSTELEEAGPLTAKIWPQSMVGVDVIGCWLTKTDTPGRACWGGEAPVTCAADRHTISTEGWPTESGEISLVYTPQSVDIGSTYLVNTTGGGENQPSGFYMYRITASGALVFGLRRGNTLHGQTTPSLAWENGRSYHVRVRWSPERAEIWRDGVLLRSWVPNVVPDSHPDVAYIGMSVFGTLQAQGSIRSLTVRSYEEVSP